MHNIPIVLISASTLSSLQQEIEKHQDFRLITVIKPQETSEIPKLKGTYKDFLIVTDVEGIDTQTAVVQNILLRNVGYQVFLSCNKDYTDLCQVTTDIYKFMVEQKGKGSIRTEIIITEHALEILGDVKSIVEEFERKFLNKQ